MSFFLQTVADADAWRQEEKKHQKMDKDRSQRNFSKIENLYKMDTPSGGKSQWKMLARTGRFGLGFAFCGLCLANG
jgi:hypothetical protein